MALPAKSSYLIGGTFNSAAPVLNDGDRSPLQLDASGNLKVTFAGGSPSNPAAGPTGSAVPGDASYTGVNVGGILQGVTGFLLNAGATIPAAVAIVDGSGNQITSFGGGTQYADGTTQATPTGTVALGKNPSNILHSLSLDASGNLNVNLNANSFGTITVSGTVIANQGTAAALAGAWTVEVTDGTNILGTASHPIRIDPTGTTTQPVSGSVSVSNFPATQPVSGTVTANQGTAAALAGAWPVEVTDGTNVLGTSSHPIRIDPTGTTTQPVSGTVSISGTVGVMQSTSPWVISGTGIIAGVPSTSVSVVDSQTVTLVDLMQTLILETRAMRKAVVYMITENGDVLDSDFEPSNQDFQPVT